MSIELSETQEAINSLFFATNADYGSALTDMRGAFKLDVDRQVSIEAADARNYRFRDLHILRETMKYLPKIKDVDNGVVGSLLKHVAHMNTYDGFMAVTDMMIQQFPEHKADFEEFKTNIEEKYKEKWMARFGNNPIKPEEYAPDAMIPDERPVSLPKFSGIFY